MNDFRLPLFVYGTLRDPDLLIAIVGRPLKPGCAHPARAPGHKAVHYPGRAYPALVRAPGVAAEGLLLIALTPFERDLLDAYEGEEYVRRPIPTMLTDEPELHEADAYLPAAAVPANAAEWSLEQWQASHKARVLAGEVAEAERLRQRLIAIRPH